MTTPQRPGTRGTVTAAFAAAGAIAFQLVGKATRDALFLSNFDVSRLPLMVMLSSAVSFGLALLMARAMSRLGPARLVPAIFGASTTLLLVEWALAGRIPGAVAVLVYLHYSGLGALLVSGLWSVLNERFDPRTAKRQIGWIGAGGTVGGVLGGLIAAQMADSLSVRAMLPLLGGLHFVSGWLVLALGADVEVTHRPLPRTPAEADAPPRAGLRILATTPYLRNIVWLVLLVSVSEGLLDYVFKAGAKGLHGGGAELLRFFALFYTGVGILTAVVQTVISRPALQRLGLARSVATLPGSVVLGGAGALIAPGLGSVAVARAVELIMRNSLARSAYEILFIPVAPRDKRATKTLVDVGVVRIGDIAGAALVQTVLLATTAAASPILLGGSVAIALGALLVAQRLHTGYLRTLERSLLARADQLDLGEVREAVTRTALLQSIADLGLTQIETTASSLEPAPLSRPLEVPRPSPTPPTPSPPRSDDPAIMRILELESGDPRRVRHALADGPLTTAAVPHAVRLLAWDEVASQAVTALRAVADRVVGQLVDHLLDPEEEFAVRRRLPKILAECTDERAADGLLRGLEDKRFEVRYRSGRALSRLVERSPSVVMDPQRVFRAVLREMAVDRAVWESQRLLDRPEDEGWSPMVDEVLRDRANRSLEHVFTMLSLVLPRQPLQVAFRGLHTDDRQLRGTALEYLENTLPAEIREKLWPFLDEAAPARGPRRSSQEVLADLLKSNLSIALNLESLRQKRERGEGEAE